MRASLPIALGALVCCAAAAAADTRPNRASGAAPGARAGSLTARVADVPTGDSFRLETGLEVRLAGTVGPDTALSGAAQRALARLIVSRTVRVTYPARAVDRYGRLHGQVHLPDAGRKVDEGWIQAAMLEAGWLRVDIDPEMAVHAPKLLAAEARARDARRGIWRHRAYRVLPASRAGSAIGRFAVVEGIVVAVAERRRTVYVDFGRNWWTAFTVGIDRGDLPRFLAAGVKPATYAGRQVRVRGWMERRNGPYIRITHPLAIELVEPAGGD